MLVIQWPYKIFNTNKSQNEIGLVEQRSHLSSYSLNGKVISASMSDTLELFRELKVVTNMF